MSGSQRWYCSSQKSIQSPASVGLTAVYTNLVGLSEVNCHGSSCDGWSWGLGVSRVTMVSRCAPKSVKVPILTYSH
eukprot:scaffold94953_cov58-Cyclotella_meneghiniana.AAC.7